MKPLPAIPISDLTFWNWVARNLANFDTVSAVPTVEKLKKGDAIIYESGTTRRLYFNVDGTIRFLGINNANKIIDLDGDTSVEVERTADGDIVWIKTAGSNRIKIDASGNVFIGDGGVTNHTKILPDGEITLFGTARVKAQIAIDNANLGKGATRATEVIIGNYNAWLFGINDDSVFTFHVPHEYASGTDIVINIDWYIDEPAGDEIKWQITWSATPHDSTEAIDSAGASVDTGDILIPTTPKFLTTNGLTIPGAGLTEGDQVGVTLKRIAITDGTNPGNEPAVVDLHIEFTKNKLGEAT